MNAPRPKFHAGQKVWVNRGRLCAGVIEQRELKQVGRGTGKIWLWFYSGRIINSTDTTGFRTTESGLSVRR